MVSNQYNNFILVPENKLREVLALAIKLSEQMEAYKNKDNPEYIEVKLLNSAIELERYLKND